MILDNLKDAFELIESRCQILRRRARALTQNGKCNRLYSLFVQVHEEIKMAKCVYGMMFIPCISNCSVVEESKRACTQKKKWSPEQNMMVNHENVCVMIQTLPSPSPFLSLTGCYQTTNLKD